MTHTTITWPHRGAAGHRAQPGSGRRANRGQRTLRILRGVLFAALAAVLLVVVGALAIERMSASALWGNPYLWGVIGFALAIALVYGLASEAELRIGALTRLQAYCAARRSDRELSAAARRDPRLMHELQILRDHAEWREPYLHTHR